MSRPTVYVETSVVSYLTARPSPNVMVAARQQVTREWWEEERGSFELFVSQAVLDEAAAGDEQAASRRLELLAHASLLAVGPETKQRN